MIRIRRLAAITAVGLAGAVAGPSAVAAPPSPAPSSAEVSTISPVSYADRAVQEFGAGDDIGLERYTTADARSAISAHDAAPKHWERTDAHGAAGHVYVTYVNTETHGELTLGVNTTAGMQGDHLVDQVR